MVKKLTGTAFKDNGFTHTLNKKVIAWVVANQNALTLMYKDGLSQKPRVKFCLDLRTKTGTKMGLTVRHDGTIAFIKYAPSKMAIDWMTLRAIGCPVYAN